MDYPINIVRLSSEDGGGYLAFFPDLIGCMSDGETPAEALTNGLLAFDEWMDAAKERGLPIPQPNSAATKVARERENLIKAVREVRDHHDQIDARLDELEVRVSEIEEQIAHAEAWSRFGQLTGVAVLEISERRLIES